MGRLTRANRDGPATYAVAAQRKRELRETLDQVTERCVRAEAALARTDDHRAVDVLRWARENGVYISHVRIGDCEVHVDAVRQLSDDAAGERRREPEGTDEPRDYYDLFERRRRAAEENR